jgi:hypothetical protein
MRRGLNRRASDTWPDRGSSPTVREGVNLKVETPSLTVGLLPPLIPYLLGLI